MLFWSKPFLIGFCLQFTEVSPLRSRVTGITSQFLLFDWVAAAAGVVLSWQQQQWLSSSAWVGKQISTQQGFSVRFMDFIFHAIVMLLLVLLFNHWLLALVGQLSSSLVYSLKWFCLWSKMLLLYAWIRGSIKEWGDEKNCFTRMFCPWSKMQLLLGFHLICPVLVKKQMLF